MFVGVKVVYRRPLSPAAAVPNACMSLAALWSKHSSRPVSTEADVAADVPSCSTEVSSIRENRKRPAVLEVPQQNKTPRRTPKSFPTGVTDLGSGSSVVFQPNAFNLSDSRRLYRALMEQVNWHRKEVVIYGKKVMQPRQVAYMASSTNLSYTYSHTKLQPEGWSPHVAQIKAKLQDIAGVEFNSCLLNLYRDGSDHMGWHSDNEKLYGDNPTIGSVSFGATRRFLLRSNSDHSDKWVCDLASGDILIMKGSTQQHWTHSIPKMLRVSQPRINLTFRQIVQPED
ncbi:hypothetical protein ABBQ32_009144 [Trebouxia sp. C0010 RCD-2024]